MRYPSPIDASTTQALHLRLREHFQRRDRKIIGARGPGCLLRVCFQYTTRDCNQEILAICLSKQDPNVNIS